MWDKKGVRIKNILFLLISFIIVSYIVSSFASSDITLNLPIADDWVNDTNRTAGFNFTFFHNADTSITQADCELFIQNDTTSGIISTSVTTDPRNHSNAYGVSIGLGNNTDHVLFMNHTFLANDSIYFWSVQCSNSSAIPSSAFASPRRFFVDITFPTVENQSMNFTNNSFLKSDFRIEILATDAGNLRGETITIELLNATRVIASASVANNTPVNLTNSSLPDGLYSDLRIRARDPAGNVNVSLLTWNLTLDTTIPVVTFVDPTPTEGNNISATTIVFNFTITETNIRHIIFEFDGVNTTINISNSNWCNDTVIPRSAPFYCNITNSSVIAKKDYKAVVYVNDSANNLVISSARTFSVDTDGPQFNIVYNWTISDSIATWNFSITDTTPASCRAKIYDREGTQKAIINGTLGAVGATNTDCVGTFNASDIDNEGSFTVRFNMTDGLNRTNQTDKLGVFTRLYSGWNLITYSDANRSVIEICNEIQYCDQVSRFNNTVGGKDFVTFSNSTPSVNNGTNILAGEGLHINLVLDSFIITNDNLPAFDSTTSFNFSLTTPGWNVMGLLNNVSIRNVFNDTVLNGTGETEKVYGKNITFATWRNASADNYLSCKRILNKCSGTTASPININLRLGYAVWMRPEFNFTVNRSNMKG